MRDIQYLVVHCSATPEGRDIKSETIKEWHTNKGWSDIGYHYIIELDGTIKLGRPVPKAGAHVRGYNKISIGICYVGGCDEDMNPKDTRTEAQKQALNQLIMVLMNVFPQAEIRGHRDFPNVSKACPSFDVKTEL